MAKTAALAFRISDEMKAQLEQAAAEHDRSVSGLVERILRAWLEKRVKKTPPASQTSSGSKSRKAVLG